jgi:membrane protease YdiL (CAAX protease family)
MSDTGGAQRRRLRILECVVFFFLVPPALYFVRYQLAFRLVPILLVGGGTCLFYLVRTGSLDRRSLWNPAALRSHVGGILTVLLPGGVVFAIGAATFLPTRFLAFPHQSPGTWALVMLLYPVLAALPQEVIFRAFFFARYGGLFSNPVALVVCNGLSFGLAHLIYGNWVAVALSTLGGWLFAYRYHRTRSLLAVGLEHGLWGDLLFTLGIGWYLYSGSIR